MVDAGRDSLVSFLLAALGKRYDVREGGADCALRVARTLGAMSPADRGAVRAALGGPGLVEDDAVVLGRHLSWMPPSWMPRDPADWVALCHCRSAMAHAHRSSSGRGAVLLDAKGDWTGILRRLEAAAGVPPTGFDRALHDVGDLPARYADEVLEPALALAGARPSRTRGLRPVATRMLLDGRRLCRQLEVSRRWHAARHAMLAVAAVHPVPEGVDAWPRAWPDHDHAGVRIRELVRRRELADEGGRDADGSGAAGLSHCVGGYVGTCMSGASRILSLRASGPDGDVRLSTAQVTRLDGVPVVAQHRGRSNAAPPPEAVDALGAYVGLVASGRLAVDVTALAPVPGGDGTYSRAGYGYDCPGAWEAVRDAWNPFVPRRFRGLSPEALADVAEPLSRELGSKWSPVPLDGLGEDGS